MPKLRSKTYKIEKREIVGDDRLMVRLWLKQEDTPDDKASFLVSLRRLTVSREARSMYREEEKAPEDVLDLS